MSHRRTLWFFHRTAPGEIRRIPNPSMQRFLVGERPLRQVRPANPTRQSAWDYSHIGNYLDNWGIGLRLNLPIGPLKLDYGLPITHDHGPIRAGLSV